MVLDGGGHDPMALRPPGPGRALDREVDRLGASAREHDLPGVAADRAGEPLVRVIDGLAGPAAEHVRRRRVAEGGAQERQKIASRTSGADRCRRAAWSRMIRHRPRIVPSRRPAATRDRHRPPSPGCLPPVRTPGPTGDRTRTCDLPGPTGRDYESIWKAEGLARIRGPRQVVARPRTFSPVLLRQLPLAQADRRGGHLDQLVPPMNSIADSRVSGRGGVSGGPRRGSWVRMLVSFFSLVALTSMSPERAFSPTIMPS